ncbi:MAG: transposase [Nostoc sp.]|uniref:transposase n=1 Tax=Nostoc sp. TaxID=1180 RepID=UPI002FF57D3B
MTPFTLERFYNLDIFETCLETCLVPVPKLRQVVTMDNTTFHKSGRIEQLIREASCQVLYLPPYFPDLNRIEKC